MPVVGDGRVTVAVPGTPVKLSAGTFDNPQTFASGAIVRSALVAPIPTNTTKVAVGGPNVRATVAAERGIQLIPTAAPIRLFTDDLSDISVDALTAGEGVTFTWDQGPS